MVINYRFFELRSKSIFFVVCIQHIPHLGKPRVLSPLQSIRVWHKVDKGTLGLPRCFSHGPVDCTFLIFTTLMMNLYKCKWYPGEEMNTKRLIAMSGLRQKITKTKCFIYNPLTTQGVLNPFSCKNTGILG